MEPTLRKQIISLKWPWVVNRHLPCMRENEGLISACDFLPNTAKMKRRLVNCWYHALMELRFHCAKLPRLNCGQVRRLYTGKATLGLFLLSSPCGAATWEAPLAKLS